MSRYLLPAPAGTLDPAYLSSPKINSKIDENKEKGQTGLKKKIILIDGNSLVYRAFFALPTTLATSAGQVTNAVYGFTSMLIKLLKEEKPDIVIVAFDRAAPTFRHDHFEEYKAHREPMPNELISQFPLVKDVLKVLNIPTFEMDGFEADDILATLASKAEAESNDVIIVTGDKDAFQLVDDHISIMTTRKGISDIVIYDRQKVEERYGVPPEKIADFLALKGDPSDNIPGVPGIGEKTAAKLIRQFGSIENLIADIDAIENKRWREMLAENAAEAELSKRLAVLERDVPIDIDFEKCIFGGWAEERVRELFSKLEFFSLLDRFLSQNKRRGSSEISDYAIAEIADQNAVDQLVSDLEKYKHLAIAISTAGENSVGQRIVSVALAMASNKVYTSMNGTSGIGTPQVLQLIKPYLESRAIAKVGHDVKRIILALWNAGIKSEAFTFDNMIAAYLLSPERSDYPIDELAAVNLGISLMEEEERERLAREAVTNLRLKPKLEDQLVSKGLLKLFEEIEMPLVPVLAKMEYAGVGINMRYLEDLSKEVEILLESIEHEIYTLAGQEFNINSPQQLGFILFEKLGLPKSRRTKTGYSTDANVLNRLLPAHPIVEKIVAHRELAKLKSTYIDALPKLINPKTGRLHTSFNQTVTATGRLSSSNPNLQNIPIRTELGQRIREAFIPSRPGDEFLAADYSQIELRLLAHYSGEEVLIKALKEDRDIHEATAIEVFGVLPEQVTPQMRRMAKVVNFGVLYGMSPYGLSDRLGIPVSDARAFIDRYFKSLPRVGEFIDKTLKEAQQKGYVETLLGRRRYIPELKSSNAKIRGLGERIAINAPLQGTAADIIKLAMVRIDKQLEEEGLQAKMVLQVHDELIFEISETERGIAGRLVKIIMENAYPLRVGLKIEISTGYNWKEAK
ncbi:MAG: DNA polymerase I [Actinobacteria bacterium]|nr:DNA polymerase I [Actinomycetota bacterium]